MKPMQRISDTHPDRAGASSPHPVIGGSGYEIQFTLWDQEIIEGREARNRLAEKLAVQKIRTDHQEEEIRQSAARADMQDIRLTDHSQQLALAHKLVAVLRVRQAMFWSALSQYGRATLVGFGALLLALVASTWVLGGVVMRLHTDIEIMKQRSTDEAARRLADEKRASEAAALERENRRKVEEAAAIERERRRQAEAAAAAEAAARAKQRLIMRMENRMPR